VTGLIYLSPNHHPDMHEMQKTSRLPLNQQPYENLHPGAKGLASILKRYA
jgi:hypothetical protein